MPLSICNSKQITHPQYFNDIPGKTSLAPAPDEPSPLTKDFFSVASIIHQVPESFAVRRDRATDPLEGGLTKTNSSSYVNTYTFSDAIVLRAKGADSLERFGLATSNVFKVKKLRGYAWQPHQAHDQYHKDRVSANLAKVFDAAQLGAILLEKARSSRIGQLATSQHQGGNMWNSGRNADRAYVNRHVQSFAAFLNQCHLLDPNTLRVEDFTVDQHCPTGSNRSAVFGSTSAIFSYFGDQDGLALLPAVGSIDSYRAKRSDRIQLLKAHFCTAFSAYRAISQILPDLRDVAVKVNIESKAESRYIDSYKEESEQTTSYIYTQNTTTSEIYIKAVSTKTGKELLLFPIMAAKEVLFKDLRTGNQKIYLDIKSLSWQEMKQVVPYSTFARHGLADFKMVANEMWPLAA